MVPQTLQTKSRNSLKDSSVRCDLQDCIDVGLQKVPEPPLPTDKKASGPSGVRPPCAAEL